MNKRGKKTFNVVITLVIITLIFFLFLSPSEAKPQKANQEKNLQLYYNFNENSNVVKDLSGKENNGIVYNAIWNSGSFKFNGESSKIEVEDFEELSPSNSNQEMTISFWIRPDTFNFKGESQGYVHFLGKGITNSQEWTFRIYNETAVDGVKRSKRISFYAFNLEGGIGTGSYFQDDLKEEEWIYVTGVIDGKNIMIYKNGVLRDKDPLSNNNIIMKDGTAPLRIGTRDMKSWFNGSIDELRIYNRVLTNSEINKLYLESKNQKF